MLLAQFDWWAYLAIPLLIFVARIVDVSVGTLRIIFISRGMALYAFAAAFFEIIVWLLAIRQVFTGDANFLQFVGYAAGFAVGNFVGIRVENRLALGKVLVRLFTTRPAVNLLARLNHEGFGATIIEGQGARGPVWMVYLVVRRRDVDRVLPMVEEYHPRAFFTVEPVTRVDKGLFPVTPGRLPLAAGRPGK